MSINEYLSTKPLAKIGYEVFEDALVYETCGTPDVLRIEEVEIP